MLTIAQPQSEAHNLNAFGELQCCDVPHPSESLRAFPLLHALCAQTPCNLANFVAEKYLVPHERKLINQTNDQKSPILLSKTPDGIIFHIQKRLIGGMYSKSFYEQRCQDPVKVFSVAEKPLNPSGCPLNVVFHNDDCEVHEISRHGLTRHIRSQLMALKPPCPKGGQCILFDSPNLGTFSTRVVKGPQVHELKLNFLKLISTMAQKGTGVYNKTIRLNPEFSSLLMLKHSKGHIRCDRCVDGIVGYRVREHNQKKTFIFVANTDDFHDAAPSHPSTSALQVMKIDYADTSNKGSRIVVVDTPEEDYSDEEDEDSEEEEEEVPEEDEEDEEPYTISLNMTVQQMVNTSERHFRTDNLKHSGCHLFPAYCELLGQQQASDAEFSMSTLKIRGG